MITLIIPVKKDDEHISHCLDAITSSTVKDVEVIIVLDGWLKKDLSFNLDRSVQVVEAPKGGPAKCRNLGAKKARFDILCFIDSDVEVHPESILKAYLFIKESNIDGVIGSYDDAPHSKKLISRFRNLLHHYHHQKNHLQPGVFWGAFGMIKKTAFFAVGGFDESFLTPSIEDIELGYRLYHEGYVVKINAELILKHRKRWTFANMVHTDTFRRALPWTMILNKYKMWKINELNINRKEKWSALFALLTTLSILSIGFSIWALFLALLFLTLFIVSQLDLYMFFLRKVSFTELLIIPFLHISYFISAISGYVLGNIKHTLTQIKNE